MKSGIVMPPPPGIFVKEDLYLRKRWKRIQFLADQFWVRWKRVSSCIVRQKHLALGRSSSFF
jgi:hypothetical protein